jgi:CBS domain-containing protein
MIARLASKRVVTAPLTSTVSEVAQLMRVHHVGCVIIVNARRPVGIVTDRDLALRVVAESGSPQMPVSGVMTPDPITADASVGIETMLSILRKAGTRRLPLVDARGAVVGIVTHDDLVQLLARELSEIGEGIERGVDASELR